MRKVLPTDHPLYDSRDPDAYVRFRSALGYDYRRKIEKRYMKEHFLPFLPRDPQSSAEYSADIDFLLKLSDSVLNGTFIDTYLMNRDQYLSKKGYCFLELC